MYENHFNAAGHLRAAFNQLPIDTERRRGDLVFNQDIQATEHVIKGSTLIVGQGEATVETYFPVSFIRPPTFTWGGELSANSYAESGSFPTVSAVVNQWIIDEPDLEVYGSNARQYFRGASLACVITGSATQRLILHWTFMGTALTNPGVRTSVPFIEGYGGVVS